MVKDFKYIIKRILIGVGIAFVLAFLKGGLILNTYALELSPNGSCVIKSSEDSQCKMPPNIITQSSGSGLGFNLWFYNSNLLQSGGSYYLEFKVSLRGYNVNTSQSTLSLFTGNGGIADDSATPDRDVSYSFYQVSTNEYVFVYSFGLDSYSNFDTIRLSWYSDMFFGSVAGITNFNGGINSATLTIYGGSSGGGGSSSDNSDIINNNNSNTQNIINNNNSNTQNIINNNNSNTQNIINNQNSNKNDIVNNNTQNTQDIINNQNSNTESTNNTIKEQFEVCESGDLSLHYSDGIEIGGLSSNGNISSASNKKVSDFILLEKNTTYTIEKVGTGLNNNYLCLFTDNKLASNCPVKYTSSGKTYTFNTGNNPYMRTTLQEGNTIILKGMGEICYNRLDKTNENLNNINNTLNDDTPVNNSTIEDLFGDIESSDTPISDLLTMPITLLQAYISGMSGTCNRIELGRLYGSMLFIPCINIENYVGSELWNLIDIVLAMYFIYEFSQLLITAFDSITSLRDNFSLLFGVEGKHIGSPSTRVERNSDLY